jgi:hypothetical protein
VYKFAAIKPDDASMTFDLDREYSGGSSYYEVNITTIAQLNTPKDGVRIGQLPKNFVYSLFSIHTIKSFEEASIIVAHKPTEDHEENSISSQRDEKHLCRQRRQQFQPPQAQNQ